MQRFSLPDTKLLKWSEEDKDKATDPEAATLGADLNAGQELYKDLQECYIPKESTNNDLAASKAVKHSDSVVQSPTSAATQQRETNANATSVVTPAAAPKVDLLPASASTATTTAGAHSYEDPSFLSFLPEDINKLNDLASTATSDGDNQRGMAVIIATGGVGNSYEDPTFVEALSEGNITDALSANV